MEWIAWAQSLSPLVKALATIALLLLVIAALSVFWQNPNKPLVTATPLPEHPGATTVTGGVAGVNNGVIADTYNAAPSQSDELAREQLADLRERRAAEEHEAEKAAEQAKRNAQDKARAAESQNVGQAIDRLRAEYINSHDGLSSALLAGTEPVPDDWMNERLRQLGIRYVYHGNPGGSYTFKPQS